MRGSKRFLPDSVLDEVRNIRSLATHIEDRVRDVSVSMDFEKAKKNAERVREWSKRESLQLYTECKEKGLYPWEFFEEEDLSPCNADGEIISPLDAFERVLYVLDVNLAQTSVEQFFAGPAMVLMPALVTRWIRQGMQMAEGAMGFVAFEERVRGMTVHPIDIDAEGAAGAAAQAPPTTTEGTRLGSAVRSLPTTFIGYREKDVAIGTYGRQLDVDYKFVKYASMRLASLIFRYIGMNIAWDDRGNIFELVDVGDGSTGAPPSRLQISGAGGAGTLVFQDIIDAVLRLNEGGFVITHWTGEVDSLRDMLMLSQFTGANFRDNALSDLFTQRGPVQTPFGALVSCPNPPADNDHLVFWDREWSIIKHLEQPLTVEADKIIGQMVEKSAVHTSHAFSKLIIDSSGVIDYSA